MSRGGLRRPSIQPSLRHGEQPVVVETRIAPAWHPVEESPVVGEALGADVLMRLLCVRLGSEVHDPEADARVDFDRLRTDRLLTFHAASNRLSVTIRTCTINITHSISHVKYLANSMSDNDLGCLLTLPGKVLD